MKTILHASAMLVVTLGIAMLQAAGQTPAAGGTANPAAHPATLDRFDLGLTFTYKVAKITNVSDSRFVIPGASLDGVYNFGGKAKNLGLAFDINGEAASGIQPGVDLSQISLVAGPRYTWQLTKAGSHKVSFYGQALVGYVHAFNSVFPGSAGVVSSANSFALQTGGGFNLKLNRTIGLRLLEADYVMTKLPNSTNSYQGDLRMSNGLVFHF
jgi:outer membrane immunogenic protein